MALLAHGYAVASTDYRWSSEAIFPAQIHDVKAAVRFLRANAAHFELDPDRFGIWGESAGGFLAALLGTTSVQGELEGDDGVTGVSSCVQAVVDLYGPTDLLRRKAQTPAGAQDPEAPDSSSARLLGGPPSRHPERARQANPITYITRGVPPFLIIHGDADPLVPFGQSELLVSALRNIGAPVEFIIVRGGGHGGDAFQDGDIFAAIRGFFDRTLALTQS
jgi:acetyl esterase/lipase